MSVTNSEHITGFGLFSDEFSWFPLLIFVWNLITETFVTFIGPNERDDYLGV